MTKPLRGRGLLFAAPVLAFLAPVIQAYATLKLPIGSHSLLLAGGVVLLALLLALAVAALHQSDRKSAALEVLKAALLGAGVLLVVDLSTYFAKSPVLAISSPLRLGAVATIWLASTAVFWLLRAQAPKLLFAGAAALLLTTAAFQVPGAWSALSDRMERGQRADGSDGSPPILYVVLDEMIGPEGIPRDLPGGEQAYHAVRELFGKHGFRLYGNAFSRHAVTAQSIPNTINFNISDDGRGVVRHISDRSIVRSSLLEDMARARPLVVYQTAHMNFCSNVPQRCETLPSFDAESKYVAYLGLGFDAQLQALKRAVSGSFAATTIIDLAAAAFGVDLNDGRVPEYFDVHAFPAWFDRFANDVKASGGANSYFAHFLSPHAPHVLNASCVTAQDRWELPYNLTEQSSLMGKELDDARLRHYGRYFEQMACLLSTLDSFLTYIDQTPAFDDTTLVLHGDHGSRISAGASAETASDRDMVDNHSALYAIKSPGIAPGYDNRIVSVQRLTAEYFSGKSALELGPDNDTVVLDTMVRGEAVVRRMPASRPAGSGT